MTAVARADAPRAPAPGPLGRAWSRVWRARRLVERNILVYRHQWIIIVSGAFEPVFYLLGIGLGLGAIIETVPLSDGRNVPYAAFVGPALVATAAMNGAVFETIFNVFFKLNYAKTYDGVLATPMGISEIAIGELLWALMRSALYAVIMFLLMVAMGLVLSPLGVLMIPAALLVAGAFAAAGLAGTSYLRTVNDFDIPLGLIVMPMFLFSGTFFPIDGGAFPEWLVTIITFTPLYHGIELIRGLSTGLVGLEHLVSLAYLVGFFALCLWIAMRRMERKLIK
jgi:lipooligosaccharide transport system permease protein